ncbi:MAG: ThiF family adenylyltransferase [Hydrogenibacillus sp.]|nr:ThiF family adenylyltransferase [Hydrogenibacillus sp.]
MNIRLSDPWERYSRQILFHGIGLEGQKKLKASRVAVVGVGALGTVIANHLTRAGVGFIRLIDRDFVERSNLQRQMLFDESDADRLVPKAIAARDKLRAVNREVEIEAVVDHLSAENAEALLTDVEIILDGTDNFAVRLLINDVSVKHRIPWVHGAVVRARGIHAFFHPPKTPCYRCLFPQPPEGGGETCDTVGVIGPIVDIIASMEVTAALKWIVGAADRLPTSLVDIDLWENAHAAIDISGAKNANCPACGLGRYEFLDERRGEAISSVLCGRNAVQITPYGRRTLDLHAVRARWNALGHVRESPHLLRLEQEGLTLTLFRDGRLIVQGTDDVAHAERLYAEYVGR